MDAGARRYGSDVPDVQVFMLEELDSAFVDWIQRSFTARGLKMDVMFLSPRFPRDVMIQKHVVEGVTAIVDLDRRCQATAKIPLQVFDRSGGSNNVRFEIYRDLDPNIAIELVLRAKSRNAPAPQVPGYGDSHYPQPYGTPQPPYGSAPAFPPPHTPTPPAAGRPAASELAGIVNSLDNATLQKVLATLQTTQAQGTAGAGYQQAAPPSTGTAQFDVNALISSIAASTAARPPAPPPAPINASAPSQQDFAKYQHQQYMGVAGAAPAAPPAAPSAADTNQQVQSIMAQLARYRQ